jgi:hypothetical protein
MDFLFKIVAILIGIFIWKAVVGSFRKASSAMHDGSYDGEKDSAPVAQNELEEQWRQAARQLGCSYDPGDAPNMQKASVAGRFSGHAVAIKRFGRNYVRYFVAFRKAPDFQVCVVRDLESIAERILDGHPVYPSKMFFPSGEPDFYCSAESEEAFDRFLNKPSNRSAVLNLVRTFPAGMFNDEGVSVRLRATTPDVSVISRLAAIANALEEPSDTPMPDLLDAEKKTPLLVPAVQTPPPETDKNGEETPKRFPPIQIGKSPASKTSKVARPSGDADFSQRTTVIRISPEARRTHRLDTLKSDAVRSSNSSSAPASAPADHQNQPVPAPKQAVADDLTVESVCAALFGKAFPGAEERAAFDAMKGRRVRWSGELLMSLPFSMDFVFGSRKGVKATIKICKPAQGSVSVQIKAVAAFPPELRERLEASKGKTVVFEGDLLKFEPFAREIYLQDASLES